jgi:hypothetical protein
MKHISLSLPDADRRFEDQLLVAIEDAIEAE